MKRILSALAISAAVWAGAQGQTAPQDYQLQQVLIMSRHNLRAPLANRGTMLEQATSKTWPKWDTPGGHLTIKGGVLEAYMGHYMREWLAQQALIKTNECPASDSVYVYANSLQRTVATAQFFMTGVFPECNIPIHHQQKMSTMDPVFWPVITDDSAQFSQQAIAAMTAKRNELQLDDSYRLLEQITDYKNSPACKDNRQCSLTETKDRFSTPYRLEPAVSGPLKIGNALVDAFTLQYYEGFPPEQIAWNQIQNDEQWRILSKLKNGYQDSLFTTRHVAKNVAAPLVKYIENALVTDQKNTPEITVLVGHDSNMSSLLAALDFKPYTLPDQFEPTPIGGKIVFQRWHDSKTDRDLMKIEYIYQSSRQIRNTEPLSLAAPAQHVTLELKGCPVDANGFCPMNKFVSIMHKARQ